MNGQDCLEFGVAAGTAVAGPGRPAEGAQRIAASLERGEDDFLRDALAAANDAIGATGTGAGARVGANAVIDLREQHAVTARVSQSY